MLTMACSCNAKADLRARIARSIACATLPTLRAPCLRRLVETAKPWCGTVSAHSSGGAIVGLQDAPYDVSLPCEEAS